MENVFRPEVGLGLETLAPYRDFASRTRQCKAELLEFIADSPLVAHNASFDQGFLNAELRRCGIDAVHAGHRGRLGGMVRDEPAPAGGREEGSLTDDRYPAGQSQYRRGARPPHRPLPSS